MKHQSEFTSLVIEYWKLLKLAKELAETTGYEEPPLLSRLRFADRQFEQILQRANLRAQCYTGQKFDANLPLNAINADEFQDHTDLIVSDTLEPAILCDGSVIWNAKVLLDNSRAQPER